MIEFICVEQIRRKEGNIIPIEDFIISLFNLKSEQIENIEILKKRDTIEYYITLIKKEHYCELCGGKAISHGKHIKKIKHSALNGFKGIIYWKARRYKCKECGSTFTERNPFAFPGFNVSLFDLQNIMKDLKNLNNTYTDIAKRYNISVTQVMRYLDSNINTPRIKLPENIGIDEIHSSMSKYGGSYLCVMVDNDSRSVFEILPNRCKRYLNNYFDSIPQYEKDTVKYVTIDMWLPYKEVAERHFKNCKVSVDSFHVIKNLMFCFSKKRVNIMNQLDYHSNGYYLLKHWHKLIELNNINLDNEMQYNHKFGRKVNKRNLYNMILDISENLTCAYELKELYRKFNKESTSNDCEVMFEIVLEAFVEADIPEYQDFTNMIRTWKNEILNSFDRSYNNRRQSNALAENMNGKIRAHLAITHGNVNFNRFRKRIIYSLNDKIYYSLTKNLKSAKINKPERGTYKKK